MVERSAKQFVIRWRDSGREPQVKPNAAYPDGKDVDLTEGVTVFCETDLPYPARRIGLYVVECKLCGLSVGITTAGRPDDPRSAKLPCKRANDAAGVAGQA